MDEEKIRRILGHRMHSVALLKLALDLRTNWREAPPITLYVNGQLRMEGNLNAITNPMFEVGLVHCRALLEFLGLCDKNGSLSQIKKRRGSDVGIEYFRNANGPLKKVEPEIALSRYGGDRDEAEKALLAILHVTNKGLAHNTMDLIADPDGDRLIEIACRGVRSLMVSYFYTPLGLPEPDTKITSRPRSET
jgi:hypothetical protein